MNAIILLAQTPTLAPSVTASATVMASVTPTSTPTATPFHVVMEQAPFWNSALGIFLVIVIAIVAGLIIGLISKKGGVSSFIEKLFADFTNVLAYVVVTFAFVAIFAIARQVVKVGGGQPFDANKALDTAKFVFGAILPLLGTWVGAVLAHYFQKENLATATQSIADLAKTVSNTGKLSSLAAKDFMIGPGKIITLPAALQGQKDEQILLSDIIAHLKTNKRDRLPLFADNKGSGAAKCVVHLSKIEKYLADKALNAGGQNLTTLKLADLLTDAQLAPTFKSSFSLVKESATLAEAKAAMDSITSAPGVPGNCYDIFVTTTGAASEPVLGWITNDIINENAKV